MFDWVWSLLYLITKTLFRIIDGLVQCANYLCGIEPITINGEKMDFLQYILSSDQIGFAFRAAVLIAMIVVVVFAIIAIIRTLAKEKAEGTPAQIAGKAIKNILIFLFIPIIMIVVINAGNVFMKAMYEATLQGSSSLGDFLFKAFAMESGVSETAVDAFLANPNLDWRNTSDVWELMDLGEFEFIFSYIAGAVILGALGMSMMYFVSRVLSLTILYIASPFSIGVSVLDEGARFKLWRDQVLIKFLTGYGMMIAINIYAMLCLLVMNPGLVFFEKGSFLDYLMKLLLICGGGVALTQSMALIGNLVSSGAGSNELRDTAISSGLMGAINAVPGMSVIQGIAGSMKQEVTGRAAQAILPAWAQRSYGNGSRGKQKGGGGESSGGSGFEGLGGGNEKGSDSQNSNSPNTMSGGGSARDVINGGGGLNDNKQSGNDNQAKQDGGGKGNSFINSAINGGGSKKNNSDGTDFTDFYE